MIRSHLLFTVRVNSQALALERARARPITRGVDLGLAAALVADALVLSAARPLVSVLTLALAVGLALATTVVEPATTTAAFEHAERHRRSIGP
jgi:hypothetical protein